MRALGLDVGAKRIGIAISDAEGLLATPLLVYERKGMKEDASFIISLFYEKHCNTVVVGLPLELNGKSGHRALRVKKLVEQISSQKFKGKIAYYDERFSTVEAERSLLNANVRREKRKKIIDKVAAAIILQAYLDSENI